MVTIRLMFLFSAITYPLIGLLYNEFSDVYDPLWHRLLFSGLTMSGLLVVTFFGWAKKHVDTIIAGLYLYLVGREMYMLFVNHIVSEYVLGVFIIVSASGVVLHRRAPLAVFLVSVFIASVLIVTEVQDPEINPVIFLAAVVILCSTSYLLFEVRYRVNVQLQESRSILNKSDSLIVLFHEDGTINRVSDSSEKLTGFNKSELSGENFWKFFDEEKGQFNKESITKFIEGGRIFDPGLETKCRTKSGREVWFRWDISMLNESLALGVGSDITELKTAYMDISQMAHILSHDIKAPLRSLFDFVAFFKEDHGDQIGNDGKEKLDILSENIGKLSALAEGVLNYSRSGVSNEAPKSMDIKELIGDILGLISVPENVTIETSLGPKQINVRPVQTHQILQNLIGNAVSHMEGENPGKVEVYCTEENDNYHFVVKDNGPGIRPEDQEKIFGLFESLKGKSTGVGLSIVKKLVDKNHGKVWVESVYGEGAAFHFMLPKMEATYKP